MKAAAARLLSGKGELGGMTVAGELIDWLDQADDDPLDDFLDYLARELRPDPLAVLSAAHAYAASPGVATLMALTRAAEPPRLRSRAILLPR